MRLFFCGIFLFVLTLTCSAEKTDSTKTRLTFNGNVSFNTNGMAPVPYFSLGKPAVIAAFNLVRKRFSYEPQIAYALNCRPWIIDNWVHFKPVLSPSFEIRTGADFSMFFSEYDTGEDKILQSQHYITGEVATIFKFRKATSLSLLFWYDAGQDPGTMNGRIYNIIFDKTDMGAGRSVLLSFNFQLFYIDYTQSNDGLFISPRIAGSLRNRPYSLFVQCTQPLKSNIEPYPPFKLNAGLAYLF